MATAAADSANVDVAKVTAANGQPPVTADDVSIFTVVNIIQAY